ncbi:MAG: hemerythrin domain-containing protein [Pseudohongiellaceae bacterium]
MPDNAIDMLKEDHKKVLGLLDQLVRSSDGAVKTRQDLLKQIENELAVHTKLEEKIFYPAFKETNGKEHRKMYFEATEEHRAVEKLVLPDLKKTEPGSEKFSGRAKVLKELVEHHAEEEEADMFPAAKKAMKKEQLEELAVKMKELKQSLM